MLFSIVTLIIFIQFLAGRYIVLFLQNSVGSLNHTWIFLIFLWIKNQLEPNSQRNLIVSCWENLSINAKCHVLS